MILASVWHRAGPVIRCALSQHARFASSTARAEEVHHLMPPALILRSDISPNSKL